MENNNKKGINKNLLISIAGIVGLSLLIFIIFTLTPIGKNRSIKQADGLVAEEKFEEAITIYDKLLEKDDSENIKTKRYKTIELMESKDNYQKGIKAIEDGDVNMAVKHLFEVSKKDEPRYEKAVEELSNLEEAVLLEIDQLVESDKLEEAQKMVNSYLNISPRNIKMQNEKDRIDFAIGEIDKQARLAEEAKEKEAEAILKAEADEEEAKEKEAEEAIQAAADEKERKKKQSDAAIKAEKEKDKQKEKDKPKEKPKEKPKDKPKDKGNAKGLIGSSKTVASENANLRESAAIKGNVITTLPRGKKVYIKDILVESEERTWCLVEVEGSGEVGWISYNTIK